jgi:hypothetical protein
MKKETEGDHVYGFTWVSDFSTDRNLFCDAIQNARVTDWRRRRRRKRCHCCLRKSCLH